MAIVASVGYWNTGRGRRVIVKERGEGGRGGRKSIIPTFPLGIVLQERRRKGWTAERASMTVFDAQL